MVVACATIVDASNAPVQSWFREAMTATAFPYASIRHAPKPDPETPSLVVTTNAVVIYALTDGRGPIITSRQLDQHTIRVFAAICTMHWSSRHPDLVNEFWRHFAYEIFSTPCAKMHVSTHVSSTEPTWAAYRPNGGRICFFPYDGVDDINDINDANDAIVSVHT